MAKKKCYKCKQSYDEQEMYHVLRHWLCNDCYGKYIKSEEYYKELLIDTVWNLYDDKPVYNQLTAQVEELHTRYNFKYEGMYRALGYYLMSNEWNQKYLLYQAFPKSYYELRDIYLRRKKLMDSLANYHDSHEKTSSSRTISYKPPLPL